MGDGIMNRIEKLTIMLKALKKLKQVKHTL